ncbi:MAG: LLM class flavin-dependent oxidoreductase [Actinomycetota bacterium]
MLQLGYVLPTRENIMNGKPPGAALLDAARRAGGLGFDSIWAGDSLLAKPRHDPLTLLAAVSGAVPDVTIGSAVLLLAMRNPVLLAHQLATLDQVSEGRLIVGASIALDAPAIRKDFAAAGVPFEKRVGRFMEAVRLMRALWSGEPVDWTGRWTVESGTLAPTPYRPSGPPLWIGANAPKGVARAGAHYDGWFPSGPGPDTYAGRRQIFIEAGKNAGRDIERLTAAAYMTLCIGRDEDQANQALDHFIRGYYPGVDPQLLRKHEAFVAGTLDQVLDYIRHYTASGAEHVVFRLVGDHETQMRQLAERRDEMHE